MASIRQRNGRFQVQIRRGNVALKTKTFGTLAEAQRWAVLEENKFEHAADYTPSTDKLADVLKRYLDEITPHKKGQFQETKRINRLLKDTVSETPLRKLTAGILTAFRDRRVQDGVRACQYDLIIIRHALDMARKEWGYHIPTNPVSHIRVPNGVRKRERRLTKNEFVRFSEALDKCWNPVFRALVQIAIETGMRQSELLRLRWRDFDHQHAVLYLQDTKNGQPRTVPLTPTAIRILGSVQQTSGSVFKLSTVGIRSAWLRLTARAQIDDYRFHDLRHEAISRFFELGLSVPEVALISGHKTPAMLFRYTHLRPLDLSKKLSLLTRPAQEDTTVVEN